MAESFSSPQSLSNESIHDKDCKYVLAEDIDESGQVKQRKAFFNHHAEAATDSDFQHMVKPLEYHDSNRWEKKQGWDAPKVQAPEQVEYQIEEFDLRKVPHVKIGFCGEQIEGIELGDDYNWLEANLKFQVVKMLMPGVSGLYFWGKVLDAAESESQYSNDILRLKTAPVDEANKMPLAVLKMYMTLGMTRKRQMKRLFEETLAHVELNGHSNIVDTYSVRFRVRKAKQDKDEINAIDGETDLHAYILMEYSAVGSFSMLIKKIRDEKLDTAYYWLYLQDIISGLAHLHSTGRAHREFNYTNCLAVKQPQDRLKKSDEPTKINCVIKICDFAYTKRIDNEEKRRNWQSMDVADFARMLLWHNWEYFGGKDKDKENEKLRKELEQLAKYLLMDDAKQRVDNFNRLLIKKEDEGKDVREFFKSVLQG